MKFKLWSKISAVFLTFWALDNSYVVTRDVYNYIVDGFGFYLWNFTGTLGLIVTFLIAVTNLLGSRCNILSTNRNGYL